MLRLDSIKIARFRGIREGEVAGFGDVNILVGPNNAGKSTVTEAIARLAAGVTGTPADLIGRDRVQHYCDQRNERQVYEDQIWFDYMQSAGFSLDGEVGGERVGMQIRGERPGSRTAVRTGEPPQPAVRDFLDRITSFLPRDAFDPQIEALSWQRIMQSGADAVLTDAVNTLFGIKARDVSFTPDARLWLKFGDGPARPVGVEGSGVQAAMRCLILFTGLEKTMFIAEEPESHLHVRALQAFARHLCSCARQREVQLFLTSHSIEGIQAFLSGAEEAGSEAVVFHLNLDKGLLTARHLKLEAVRALDRLGTDVRDLHLYA
ncbi:MAG: AAA family ATPase [Planctomycetes bacterium]|nr:AAA family ATPase [Planctomycetota bacterium]